MKRSKYILLLAAGLISVASCRKAIDVDPISTITATSYYKTPDDVTGGIRGMYASLRIAATSDMFFMGEGRSDVLTSATAGTTGLDKYYLNTLNATNPGPNWQQFYTTINAANLLIKYIPAINFTSQTVRDNALAQAYTMRAFIYFVLVRTWGEVPIRTQPTESYDPASVQVAKSSVQDVFKLIKADIDMAISLYPNVTPDANRAQWSKPAAEALKGDVYLWTGKMLSGGATDFTTALTALNDISTTDFTLLPNYSDIFSYTNKGNKEELFAVRFQQSDFTTGNGNNYWSNMYITNLGASTAPKGVSAASIAIIGTQGNGNNGANIMQITQAVRNQFTTDDQRRAGTFYEIYNNDGTYLTSITTKGAGTVIGGSRNFYTDVMIYRYADVLLMKAEAKNALGQDPSAEMIAVRQRAYGSNYSSHVFVNGTQAANDAAILKERLLELATEGKRWWDLVRFGQAFNLVPSLAGKQSQTYLLLFPVGSTIRSLEPLVTENTGW
ncbi:RagB/SusD family nutrient uptake outer membrane protein [Mucilaginibacter boryungensis]|uniref:RagB/SusD family nutrient uptake outer membrane protein n=1 Tax=Mucilaginibacter boryungensis TaxID=768480 RepID=A0ABR9XGB3_9SPHI|nr:RagB/SusD family nutrient uptake outer membrane protein [Mucilaginibacter boryungensis]MBE9666114.1 RagB/SusD family nutrient uptake outer membrane protein [Mucilaginibacter boryungensis]